MGLSMFSMSTAFISKYRGIVLLNVAIGFGSALVYGSYKTDQIGTIFGIPSIFLFMEVVFAIIEWAWRHFHDDEDCPIYKTFNK